MASSSPAKEPNEAQSTEPRWALVTGASSGIGEAFARQLASQRFNLVLVARREERLNTLAKELKESYEVRCRVLVVDLSVHDACDAIAQTLADENIAIDYLINNAGYGVPGKLVSVDWSTHEDFLQVMVTSVVKLCRLFMPGMLERGYGRIINVASVAGLVPNTAGHTLYGASKAFLVKFSEALAGEGAPEGVHVSALCPGFTYSEFHDVTGTRQQVSRLPSFLWLQAQDVVRYGLESVERNPPRVIAVPGRVYRLLAWLSATAPWLGRRLAGRSSHHFRKLD